MSTWLVIAAGGGVTFALRLSFIYFLGRVAVPETMRRALRFVPPAVLAAIVLPALMAPSGVLDLSLGNQRMLAGAVSMLVAWRTRSVLATIVAGMLILAVLQLAA
jgi:branched-subunit amino acid transport protein